MRALVLDDYSLIKVHEVPDLVPGPGEVLIKVAAVGICGSDIHGFTGANGRRFPGQVMGHEAGGTVAAVGAEAFGTVGTPVTFNPLIGCGQCEQCSGGTPQRCSERKVIGVSPEISAAFAEYVVVPARNVRVLPDGMSPIRGALIEPLAVAFHATRRAGITPGDVVLVIGGGPIGQSIVLAAQQYRPTRVLVSDLSSERRNLVASLGSPVAPVEVLDPTAGPLATQVRLLAGRLADVTIEAVGVSISLADALQATQPGGTVTLVGMGSPRLELDAYAISTHERSLIGCFCYTDQDFDTAVSWAGDHPDQLERLISAEISLDQAPQAFADLAGTQPSAGKVLVLP